MFRNHTPLQLPYQSFSNVLWSISAKIFESGWARDAELFWSVFLVFTCKLCPQVPFIGCWYTRCKYALGTRLSSWTARWTKCTGMIRTHSYLKSVVNMSVNKEERAVNGGDNPTDVWENSTVWTVGEWCCWGICHGFHDHLLNSIISWNLSLPRRQLLDFQWSSLFWHFISIKNVGT